MTLLLLAYSGLILLASLAGGWIPLYIRLTHTRMQLATSFVAGLMLGVGVLHLLPHALHEYESIDGIAGWLLAGFLTMFFIQRFFHFHHHDVPGESQRPDTDGAVSHSSCHAHDPIHEHEAGAASLAERSASKLTWTGAVLGLTLHTLIDGIALAASVQLETTSPATVRFMGFSTFLVIILHKPFDALAIGALMAASGRSKAARHWVNGLFALAIPVGIVLFQFGAGQFAEANHQFLGSALAFAAGTFICISTSDLLPELQFHSHDRVKLSIALLSGILLSVVLGAFEETGHDHREHAVSKSSQYFPSTEQVEIGSSAYSRIEFRLNRVSDS